MTFYKEREIVYEKECQIRLQDSFNDVLSDAT